MNGTTSFMNKLRGSVSMANTIINGGASPYPKHVGPAPICSFSDGAQDAPLKSLKFSIEPKQSGSGDPSPSNIRPISGWTQIDGARAGDNLMPGFDSGLWGTADSTGWTISNFSSTPASFPFDMPAGKYTGVPAVKVYLRGGVEHCISASPGHYWCISYYDSSGTKIGNGAAGWGVGAFTPPVGTAYAIFGISNYQGTATTLTASTQVQIAIGSSLPAWTAYKDTTPITISIGQTVYGGTVDALNGKCYARPYYASYSGQALVGPWISSHDKYVAGGTPTTGAQVVDLGGTETTLSLTPVSVSSLLGQNNIWCNTGDTELDYYPSAASVVAVLNRSSKVYTSIPLGKIRYDTYQTTPNQALDLDSYRAETGVLIRNVLSHTATKIEFNTPSMTNLQWEEVWNIIKAGFNNSTERKLKLKYFDQMSATYKTGWFYVPDVQFTIRNIDEANGIINYDEVRVAFIEY